MLQLDETAMELALLRLASEERYISHVDEERPVVRGERT